MKKRKTILSLILSVAMLFGTLPSGMVFAADTGQYTVSLAASAETVDSGETVDVSVDVTSGSQSTYKAFYAVLSYDSQKFDYSGDAAVNGFSVDSSTAGTLKISRVGSVVSISDSPDLSLTFTAKSGGKGTFSLTSAKVDAAANAEKDAPEALVGEPVQVTVPVNLITEIRTEQDLRAFADSVNAGADYSGLTVELKNDVNLTQEWLPVGTAQHPFKGDFNGNGFTVSGMFITDEDTSLQYIGLFGYVNGNISNLTVEGTLTPPDYDRSKYSWRDVGGVVAYTTGSLDNCIGKVDITASSTYIGGVVGECLSTITSCKNYGTIIAGTERTIDNLNPSASPNTFYGGIAGGVAGGAESDVVKCANYGDLRALSIKRMSYSGAIAGDEYIGTFDDPTVILGGIIGSYAGKNIRSSCNKGIIEGTFCSAGGIASDLLKTTSLQSCYNTGSVTYSGQHERSDRPAISFAGLIGRFLAQGRTLTADSCYSIGDVQSNSDTEVFQYHDLYNLKLNNGSVNTLKSSHVYSKADSEEITLENLGSDYKEDTDRINGGYPVLEWEQLSNDSEQAVTITTDPADAEVIVYRDADHTEPIDDYHLLRYGTYFYTAARDGYETVNGSFSVMESDVELTITLKAVSVISFVVRDSVTGDVLKNVDPVVKDANDQIIQKGKDGKYLLYTNKVYNYTFLTSGYNGLYRSLVPDKDETIEITLTPAAWGVDADRFIYGDGNEGKTHEITSGGTYSIGEGATGVMTVKTKEPVILIGRGTAESTVYENLYIVCREAGTDLTLQDVYISNTDGKSDPKMTNMIDYTGKGNSLRFGGISILDQDTGATGYAMIHVDQDTELSVGGVTDQDELYLYKREQGAGIGGNGGASGGEGQKPETNGKITITGGRLFMKNSKQGALIGAGSDAGKQTPGDIVIEGGVLNLAAMSRGGAIGGSAGPGGASSGSNVHVKGGTISINVDWSGSAIGGGGFDPELSGDQIATDADGGTLYFTAGSIRTFIDQNALGAWKVNSPGVNRNKAITAAVKNESGDPLYLFQLDTTELSEGTDDVVSGTSESEKIYTVKEGDRTVYRGDLHRNEFICAYKANADDGIATTIDNWVPLDDPNLYLYLTGEDHTLDVNGQTVNVVWDSGSETFTVTSGETPSGPVVEDYTKNSAAPAAWSFNEEGTDLTVTCSSACSVIAVAADGSCQRIQAEAADTENTYSFPVPEGGSKIVIVRKGDVNRDGKLTVADAAQTKAASLGKIVPSDALQAMLLDVSGDGKVNVTDAAQVKAATLGKISFSW